MSKENTNKGNLIVISAPSGCGKDTVVRELLKSNSNMFLSISCTSRSPREGEVNGKDYYFLTKEEFEQKISIGDFLEYAEYVGNYYGTLKSKTQEKLDAGIDVILVIEVQGALKIKEILPNSILIFLLPPSIKELKNRLEKRGTDSSDKILKRLKTAYQELGVIDKYDYVVVNDQLDIAVKKIEEIIHSEKSRVDRLDASFIEHLRGDIQEITMYE